MCYLHMCCLAELGPVLRLRRVCALWSHLGAARHRHPGTLGASTYTLSWGGHRGREGTRVQGGDELRDVPLGCKMKSWCSRVWFLVTSGLFLLTGWLEQQCCVTARLGF